MTTRQAKPTWLALALLLGLWACTPLTPPVPTRTPVPPTNTIVPSPLPPTVTPTVTPLTCLTQPGRVERGVLQTTKPPQEYLIYLPPCYDQKINLSYPVLYLLHGMDNTDAQWVNIGAVKSADRLILSGDAPPFIIVFPDDRYWNLPPGPEFGDRLINALIPYIDQTYRTQPDRAHRSLGGLSRGGGWTVELGLTHPELFGALGLHSPVIFAGDTGMVNDWIRTIPLASFPRLGMDIGDQDTGLGAARLLENSLAQYEVAHEFHVYTGDHTENYWGRHVDEYIRWYAQGWMPAAQGTPQP
jgi:enterochelin esterase family protein